MRLALLDEDSIFIIFSFLQFKDAIHLCYANKECYNTFLIFCYRYTFVSLNLTKHEYIKYMQFVKADKSVISNETLSFDIFEIFSTSEIKIKSINVRNQIKYANCLTNISDFNSIRTRLPKYLKYISFGRNFNVAWDKNILPDSVEVIIFHPKSRFNYNMSAINLPTKLKKIHFNAAFDKPIDNLPDSLEIILFCKNSRFNRFIKKYPNNLKEIYFGDYYNQSLKNMGKNIELINFSNNAIFNNSIEYPPNLEKIYYGRKFNQIIDFLLQNAQNIKIIKFTNQSVFNQPISNQYIGNKLEYIHFGIMFNQPIDLFEEFANLKTIKFYLKSYFDQALIHLPGNLETLYIGKHFNQELSLNKKIKCIKFTFSSKFKKLISNTNIHMVIQYPTNYKIQ